MAGDFTQVTQKMAWANHQATLIGQELAEYVNREPYVTFIEDKPELQGYYVTARLHEAPPAKVALLAGDFLNNAQGVLDYLAWQLVVREGAVPGSPTNFPIHLPNEDGSVPTVQVFDRKGREAMGNAAILEALDAVQPYKDGPDARGNPLYILKVLNREAKHRHLPLLVASIPAAQISGGFVTIPERIAVFADKRLKDEQEVKFVPYATPPNPRLPQEVKLTASVAVEGSPGEEGPDLGTVIATIHNTLLGDVLPRFQAFF